MIGAVSKPSLERLPTNKPSASRIELSGASVSRFAAKKEVIVKVA
jgi:hypothetical protein